MSEGAGVVFRVGRGLIGPSRSDGPTGEKVGGRVVTCDPGAYLLLESTTNLLSGVWQTDGAFTTIGNTNIVFVGSDEEVRFWRIRRATGESP